MASFPNNIDHDIYILQGSESDLTQNLMHSADFQESKSQNIIPYPLTQKKSNNNSILQEEKSVNAKNDVSQLENQPSSKSGQRHPIVLHSYKSLFPEVMKKKKKSGYQISGTQLTVYYFNTTKWISFPKNQLNKKFVLDSRSDVVGRQQPLIKYLIPLLVKQYCVEFLNFQPLEVNHQYFQLKISSFTNQDDPLVDPFSHQDQIDWLFSCSNLVLLRRQKDYERLKVWQKKISTDMEALQIIIPFQRQIIQQVQKNKTLGSLKQKILTSNRLGSNIAIVTYGSFIGCDLKKKIGDIVTIDRILQVYRVQSSGFQDVEQNQQRQKMQKNYKQQSILTSKQSHPLMDQQFQVSQSLYSGKLYIQVLGTKIIQKYEGGMVSYITSYQRRVQRSVQTLVGISIQQTTIKMKFLSKSGSEICIYNFQSKSQKQSFFRCINQIGRFLKQNFQKIPQ